MGLEEQLFLALHVTAGTLGPGRRQAGLSGDPELHRESNLMPTCSVQGGPRAGLGNPVLWKPHSVSGWPRARVKVSDSCDPCGL